MESGEHTFAGVHALGQVADLLLQELGQFVLHVSEPSKDRFGSGSLERRVDCLECGFESPDLLGLDLAFGQEASAHDSTHAGLEAPEYLLDLSVDADHLWVP